MKGRDIIMIIVGLAVAGAAFAFWPRGAQTYEQCVVDELRGQSNSKAHIAVARLCRQRFPLPSRELPPGFVLEKPEGNQ